MSVDITIPGSKSITNRALVLATLCGKTSTIKGAAICDDSKYMLKGLKALGHEITQKGDEIMIEQAQNNTIFKNPIRIFTGNAGTTTRFLTALATLSNHEVLIEGDERMNERPIKELVDALNHMGANIKSTNGCPPLEIKPNKPQGKEIIMGGKVSSQYISAIMMIAPFLEGDSIIKLEQKTCSKPYIRLTAKLMKAFGLNVVNKNFEQIEVKGKQTANSPAIFKVEGDASSASYMGAFAALNHQTPITLTNIHSNSIQGDIKFLEYLKNMGCKIDENEKGTTIEGPKELKSLGEVDMNDTPDLVMTFAILAIFTEGKTRITNIPNLKIKETDRLKALQAEISKLGVTVTIGEDYIEIEGNVEHFNKKDEITIQTYSDHRIAMCFGIILNKFPNIIVENPNCVSKSYKTFWEDLEKSYK